MCFFPYFSRMHAIFSTFRPAFFSYVFPHVFPHFSRKFSRTFSRTYPILLEWCKFEIARDWLDEPREDLLDRMRGDPCACISITVEYWLHFSVAVLAQVVASHSHFGIRAPGQALPITMGKRVQQASIWVVCLVLCKYILCNWLAHLCIGLPFAFGAYVCSLVRCLTVGKTRRSDITHAFDLARRSVAVCVECLGGLFGLVTKPAKTQKSI